MASQNMNTFLSSKEVLFKSIFSSIENKIKRRNLHRPQLKNVFESWCETCVQCTSVHILPADLLDKVSDLSPGPTLSDKNIFRSGVDLPKSSMGSPKSSSELHHRTINLLKTCVLIISLEEDLVLNFERLVKFNSAGFELCSRDRAGEQWLECYGEMRTGALWSQFEQWASH